MLDSLQKLTFVMSWKLKSSTVGFHKAISSNLDKQLDIFRCRRIDSYRFSVFILITVVMCFK